MFQIKCSSSTEIHGTSRVGELTYTDVGFVNRASNLRLEKKQFTHKSETKGS